VHNAADDAPIVLPHRTGMHHRQVRRDHSVNGLNAEAGLLRSNEI
jgi:hypothetical protein